MFLGRNSVIIKFLAITFAVVVTSCSNHNKRTEFDALPVLRKAPVVIGTNYDGKQFSSETLHGKIWLADFIFTTCAEICPKMSGNTAQLVKETSGKVPVVSISVDPEYDTLQVLSDYAAKYAGNNKEWYFLHLPIESVKEVSVKGFGVGNYENPLEHSTRLILIDEKGMIRGYFDGTDSTAVRKLTGMLKGVVE